MATEELRRTDRVVIELPIVVSGTDAMGEAFLEQSVTLVLGRHGAKIALSRKLVPDQEINIRCLGTARESDARVVGQIGEGPDGYYYGIELLDSEVELWDIEFPPADETAVAVGRVLLECMRCHSRELAYLNEFEAEVLEANQYLSRHCRKCADTSLWRESQLKPEEVSPAEVQPPAPPPPRPRRTRNDRKHVRLDLKVDVCIRHPQYGEEVVATENVSRGGFRFRSHRHYREGWIIEAALPYSRGAANIFTPAQIVYASELPDATSVYGVAYIPGRKARPEA